MRSDRVPRRRPIDTPGRILAQKLAEAWGQNVVMENCPGAGGNSARRRRRKRRPTATPSISARRRWPSTSPSTQQGFDPVRDLDAVMLVATAQDVLLVPPNAPYRSGEGAHRGRQGAAGRAPLCLARPRHQRPSLHRPVRRGRRHQAPACALTTVSQAVTDIMTGRIAVFLPTLGGHARQRPPPAPMRALAVSGTARAAQLPGRADLQRARA